MERWLPSTIRRHNLLHITVHCVLIRGSTYYVLASPFSWSRPTKTPLFLTMLIHQSNNAVLSRTCIQSCMNHMFFSGQKISLCCLANLETQATATYYCTLSLRTSYPQHRRTSSLDENIIIGWASAGALFILVRKFTCITQHHMELLSTTVAFQMLRQSWAPE